MFEIVKTRNIIRNVFIITIILGSIIGIFIFQTVWSPKERTELLITSDQDFIKLGFPGDGTKENPYRIEFLELGRLEKKMSDYTLISVRNTSKFFIITNCKFSRGSLGIYISNVANYTASIENNHFFAQEYCKTQEEYSCYFGNAILVRANGVKISNNTFQSEENEISAYGEGIKISGCNSIIQNNTFRDTGLPIYVNEGKNISITYNHIYHFFEFGMNIYESEQIKINNNIFENYVYNALYTSNSKNVTIENNVFKVESAQTAIRVHESENIFINYNYIVNFTTGIRLTNCENILIYLNEIWNCSFFAIDFFFEVSFAIVYHNLFMFNGWIQEEYSQCMDNGINNFWYNVTLNEGNFWSDLGTNTTYTISGSAGSIDLHPMN